LKSLEKGRANAALSTAVTYLEQAAGAQALAQQLLVVLQAVMERAPIATMASRMMFFIMW
jgi:hypothetical protein